MKKILVTGSEGYIGSVLVPLLLNKGYDVDGLDTSYYTHILGDTPKHTYHLITQDIRNIEGLDLSVYDAIIHLAALSNDPIGELNDTLTEEINYQATCRLVQLAKDQGVKRFIFSSSCSIYGIGTEDEVNESSQVNPLTAYAKSKILVENELIKLSDDNFCVGIMRNSTVYGYSPKFRDDLVVNNLTACAFTTNKIKIMSDGSPWRPLIDIRDLSEIFAAFLEIDSDKINSEIFNIGFNENNLQVKNIADVIQECLPGCTIEYTGEHGNDSRSYKVSFNKFSEMFPTITRNWSIKKSVEDLIFQFKNANFSQKQFIDHEYTRLTNLQELINSAELNNDLFWTH